MTKFIDISNKQLHVRDCWINQKWNSEFLEDLVGEEATEEMLQARINGREGMDNCFWNQNSY